MAVHPPERTMETHLASCRVHGHGPGRNANSVSTATPGLASGIDLAVGDLERHRSRLPEPALHGARWPPLGPFCTVQDPLAGPVIAVQARPRPAPFARCKASLPGRPWVEFAPCKGDPASPPETGPARRPRGRFARCKIGPEVSVLHGARPRFRIAPGPSLDRFCTVQIGPANQPWTTQERCSWVGFAPCKMAAPGSVLHRARPASWSRSCAGGRCTSRRSGAMFSGPARVLWWTRIRGRGEIVVGILEMPGHRPWVGFARCNRVRFGPILHGAREAERVGFARGRQGSRGRSCTVQNGARRVDLAPCKTDPGAGRERPGSEALHRAKQFRGRPSCTVQGRVDTPILHRAKRPRGRCARPGPGGHAGPILHRAKSTQRRSRSEVLHRAKPTRGRRAGAVRGGLVGPNLHRAKPTQGRLGSEVLHRAKGAGEGSSSELAGAGVGASLVPDDRVEVIADPEVASGSESRRGSGPRRGRFARCKIGSPGSICTVQEGGSGVILHGARPAGFASRFR